MELLSSITAVPALVKVFGIFFLILGLNRLRLTLSLCLLVGALALGFWMEQSPAQLLRSAWGSLSRPQTVSLVLIVGSILVLSRLMSESGQLDRMVRSFQGISGDQRTAGSVMPALVGLLPMPGGALFSAPMVETAFDGQAVSGEHKTAVNYWFRHIWEYIWPVYPGVILAVTLLEVETWRFMAVMAPMTFLSILAGRVFLLRPLAKNSRNVHPPKSWAALRAFLWETMPILVVVLVILGFTALRALLGLLGLPLRIVSPLPVLLGILASLIWVARVNRIPAGRLRAALFSRNLIPMMALVAVIMVFKGVLEDSQAVIQIRDELVAYHIPLLLIIIVLPFLSGLILGIAVGFVGASFPLVIPLLHTTSTLDYLSQAALAFTFGFMGMMLSPMHLCLLVTKDHFKASLLGSYRHLLLPVLAVMASAMALYLISRLL